MGLDDATVRAHAERIFEARKDRAKVATDYENAIVRVNTEYGEDDRYKGNIPSVISRVRGIFQTCMAVKREMSNPHNTAILFAEELQKAACYRAATLAFPQRPFL